MVFISLIKSSQYSDIFRATFSNWIKFYPYLELIVCISKDLLSRKFENFIYSYLRSKFIDKNLQSIFTLMGQLYTIKNEAEID